MQNATIAIFLHAPTSYTGPGSFSRYPSTGPLHCHNYILICARGVHGIVESLNGRNHLFIADTRIQNR